MGNGQLNNCIISCCDKTTSTRASDTLKSESQKIIYNDPMKSLNHSYKKNYSINKQNEKNNLSGEKTRNNSTTYSDFFNFYNKVLLIQNAYRRYQKRKKVKMINTIINQRFEIQSNKANCKSTFTILDCINLDISNDLSIEQEKDNINDCKKFETSKYIKNSIMNNNNANSTTKKISSKESSLKNSLIVDLQSYENDNKSLIVSKNTIFSQDDNSSKPSIYASRIDLMNLGLNKDVTKSLIVLNPNEMHGHFLQKPKKTIRFKGRIDPVTKAKNGYGHVTWDDGSMFQAYFKNNYAEGFCRFINTPGNSFYSGLYYSNVPYNYGIFTQIDKNITYEGEWIKNDLDGIGIEISKDYSIYQGEFKKCAKNGIGIYRWIDDRMYEGEFINNQIEGYGILTYKDEKKYQGEFKEGRLNGLGMFTWSSGSIYSGYYKDDLKHGFGIFVWKVNPLSAYIGFWSKGKQHGIGELILYKQDKLYGLWEDGKALMYTSHFSECENYLQPNQFKYKSLFTYDPKNVFKLFQIPDNSYFNE